VLHNLCLTCAKTNTGEPIYVEFVFTELCLTRNGVADPNGRETRFLVAPYEKPAPMGSGISLRDTLESGTIGGYITLSKRGSAVGTFGLTCHHVLSLCDENDFGSETSC
jgi:hypothetical protein